MPYKPRGPCGYPGCVRLADKAGYCAEHGKEAAHRYELYDRDPETRKRYGTQWRKVREIYRSAHPLCEMCLDEGNYVPAVHVHHKRELRDGGTHSDDNLMSLCQSCHMSIHMSARNKKHGVY